MPKRRTPSRSRRGLRGRKINGRSRVNGRSRALGWAGPDHIKRAEKLVNAAWTDLERMPPTCEGGIALASRALEAAGRAQAHLASVDDRSLRKEHTKLYSLANKATKAANDTIMFFKRTCKAPARQAAERPSFSRRK